MEVVSSLPPPPVHYKLFATSSCSTKSGETVTADDSITSHDTATAATTGDNQQQHEQRGTIVKEEDIGKTVEDEQKAHGVVADTTTMPEAAIRQEDEGARRRRRGGGGGGWWMKPPSIPKTGETFSVFGINYVNSEQLQNIALLPEDKMLYKTKNKNKRKSIEKAGEHAETASVAAAATSDEDGGDDVKDLQDLTEVDDVEGDGGNHRNIINFKQTFSQLLESVMDNYLQLLDVLIRFPALNNQKVDHLEQLFINFHNCINDFRAHQAREALIKRMTSQVEEEKLQLQLVNGAIAMAKQRMTKAQQACLHALIPSSSSGGGSGSGLSRGYVSTADMELYEVVKANGLETLGTATGLTPLAAAADVATVMAGVTDDRDGDVSMT